MPVAKYLQEFGNLITVIFDDGSKQLAYPTSGNLWIIRGNSALNDFIYPFSTDVISSRYRTVERPTHNGLDFSYSGILSDPISCAANGVVIVSNFSASYGNYCIVDHGTINGANVKTLYAHMETLPIVSVDDVVIKGQNLGPVGDTGDSTGPHLHWEIRVNDDFVDPEIFMLDYT